MSDRVLLLTPKAVFDVIYETALNNTKDVPKAILMLAVQQTAILHKAQFHPKHFQMIFEKMLFRNILVETDVGYFRPAHAS